MGISMIFSFISVLITFINLVTQKQIYEAQNSVFITLDISDKSVIDNLKICELRMNEIKSYLCRSVLVVNAKSIKIMKPLDGVVQNGLQLQIHITLALGKDPDKVKADYEKKLRNAIEANECPLHEVIKKEWQLSAHPDIEYKIYCIKSQAEQREELRSLRKNSKSRKSLTNKQYQAVNTDVDTEQDGEDEDVGADTELCEIKIENNED